MADQDQELKWRRQAIRLRLEGWRPCEIRKRIPRSREWLRKWWQRFSERNWDGLHERSWRPAHAPQAYAQRAHTVVTNVRRALEQRHACARFIPSGIGARAQMISLYPCYAEVDLAAETFIRTALINSTINYNTPMSERNITTANIV